MKRFDDISDIMKFMLDKHKFVGKTKSGGYGTVMLRKSDGTRQMIHEFRYFRIFKHELLAPNVLALYNIITGMSFRGKQTTSSTSILYLTDLLQINVYDHGTHFFTDGSVDFAYVLDEDPVKRKLVQAWIEDDPGVVRATWCNPDKDIDDLLDELTFARRVERVQKGKRNLDIEHAVL